MARVGRVHVGRCKFEARVVPTLKALLGRLHSLSLVMLLARLRAAPPNHSLMRSDLVKLLLRRLADDKSAVGVNEREAVQ